MNVLLFGGTTEGRLLSRDLADAGMRVTVSVATEYGREKEQSQPGVTVVTGRRGPEEITSMLTGFDCCVDATHPYAVQASADIRSACAAAGVPVFRLERARSAIPADAVTAASAAEACAFLRTTAGTVLLTTGIKELPDFSALPPERVVLRTLPTPDNVRAALAAGLPHKNIIAMEGPFSEELNEAVLRQWNIKWLVTKDGGTVGGFPEKVRAAAETGAGLVVIRSPEGHGDPYEVVFQKCKEMLK